MKIPNLVHFFTGVQIKHNTFKHQYLSLSLIRPHNNVCWYMSAWNGGHCCTNSNPPFRGRSTSHCPMADAGFTMYQDVFNLFQIVCIIYIITFVFWFQIDYISTTFEWIGEASLTALRKPIQGRKLVADLRDQQPFEPREWGPRVRWKHSQGSSV